MKKLVFALSVVAFAWGAGAAVTYTDKVLNGEWLINGSDDVLVKGSLSGTGDIRFRQTQGYISMECNNTAVGNIYNDWGLFYVNTADSFGSATIYVNDETTSGRTKSLYLWRSMTVSNPMVLGTERTANWGPRLRINKSITVALKGPITVNESKIAVEQKSKVSVSGGISGNKVVLSAESEAAIDIAEKPMTLTGTLFVGGPGWNVENNKVVLSVAGNTTSGLYGFDNCTLKLGVDNPFAKPVPFAPQNGKKFNIDLNGHNLDLGSCANEGAGYGDTSSCTILNSATTGTIPTVSVAQENDNSGVGEVGAAVVFSGRMNFTKKGSGRLMPRLFDIKGGTLRVEAGEFRVRVAGSPALLANTVVVAGGTLNLNGGTFACHRLEQRGGKITNGKLVVRDENILYADTDVTAEIVGKTVKPSGVDLTFDKTLAAASPMTEYALPAGTVFYMPFDTVETLSFDYGSCRADMFVAAGTPTFAADGKAGGCLYVNGGSHLEARGGVPAGFPVGAAPVTVSCWIKPASDCSNRGGWFSYGGTATGRGSSYSFTGSYTQVKWYANDVDVYTGPTLNLNDGSWHHVVGVWDGTYRDLYVDGIHCTHQSGKPLNTDTSVLMVGKTMWDDAFKGWIDEVLVLDHAASAEELASLYTVGIPRKAGTVSAVTLGAGTMTAGSGSLAVAYQFDSEETFLQDASKTGATLTNNGATYSTDSAFGSGGSAAFNGSSSYLSLASFPSAIPSGNKARTLLCFAKPASGMPAEGAFMSYGAEGWGSGNYLNFAFRSSSGSTFGLFPWGADNVKATGQTDVMGNWQSFAAVWDGSKVTLYRNGAAVFGPTAFDKGIIPNTTAANFKIGKAFYNGTSYFKGNLDEVAVCNRALTAAEIAAYAQSGVGALMAKPLAANTALTLESGAVLSTPYMTQTIATLGGAGSVSAKAVTVTQELSGSVSVSGDLTLGDGVVIRAGAAPTVVSGKVTIAGGGTILMPDNLPKQGAVTLIRAGSFAGTENLSDCTFSNLPNRMIAKLKIRNGNELILTWSMPGLLVILR